MPRECYREAESEFPLLESLGLVTIDIAGDGNCLFSALSDQIFGNTSKARTVRKNVVKYMRLHPEDFKPFLAVNFGGGTRRSNRRKTAQGSYDDDRFSESQIDTAWEDHLENMARSGVWAGNIEIRAFAKAYGINVHVFNSNYECTINSRDDDDNDSIVQQTAYIAYHDWRHYSSVRNAFGPFTGLPVVKAIDTRVTKVPGVKCDSDSDKPPIPSNGNVRGLAAPRTKRRRLVQGLRKRSPELDADDVEEELAPLKKRRRLVQGLRDRNEL